MTEDILNIYTLVLKFGWVIKHSELHCNTGENEVRILVCDPSYRFGQYKATLKCPKENR